MGNKGYLSGTIFLVFSLATGLAIESVPEKWKPVMLLLSVALFVLGVVLVVAWLWQNRATLPRITRRLRLLWPSLNDAGQVGDAVNKWPDFVKWQNPNKSFRLWQAAYLWANQEPKDYPLPDIVERYVQYLGAQARAGNLMLASPADQRAALVQSLQKKIYGHERDPSHDWLVTWDLLKKFASDTIDKPPFLFPEERGSGPNAMLKRAIQQIRAATGVAGGLEAKSFEALRQAARDGEVIVWGRPNSHGIAPDSFSAPHEKIPADHWRTYGFDFMRCAFDDDARKCGTLPDDGQDQHSRYRDLKVNMIEVREKWPVANI